MFVTIPAINTRFRNVQTGRFEPPLPTTSSLYLLLVCGKALNSIARGRGGHPVALRDEIKREEGLKHPPQDLKPRVLQIQLEKV